ncbi:MAG TPA: RdgB/HAM1 family non-canonical purine NTP pyrophosphatase [Acidimicrobiia bacterium]|jgi:XTP/dITP diphosphohydrolase
MRLSRLVIGSQNPDKVAEVEAVLAHVGLGIEIVRGLSWPEVEETEDTLEGNALLKARAVRDATGIAAVADDTGLEIAALSGAPGVHTARYAGPEASYADNVAKLLAKLRGVTDRNARFRTVIAVAGDDGSELVVEGRVDGRITTQPRGTEGFGYDPVFEVGGRTLAEMDIAQKNLISHRARAIRSLAEALAR